MLILGQSEAVLIHQLSNGGLLLFTSFMISDPMTTPNRHALRLAYAFMVAALAFAWQFVFFTPNGPVWALFILTPLVPVIDWLWPGKKHVWQSQSGHARAEFLAVPPRASCCAPPHLGWQRSISRLRRTEATLPLASERCFATPKGAAQPDDLSEGA